MRLFVLKQLVLCSSLLVLASCSGGDGSVSTASKMTVTTGASTTTYTSGPINTFGYYDPSFNADLFSMTSTQITMCSGVTDTTCGISINITTAGTTPGPYPITGTRILYSDHGAYYDSIASSVTVTLTSVGNVGEPITGSFQAVLGLRTDLTTTQSIYGTFSVIRDH